MLRLKNILSQKVKSFVRGQEIPDFSLRPPPTPLTRGVTSCAGGAIFRKRKMQPASLPRLFPWKARFATTFHGAQKRLLSRRRAVRLLLSHSARCAECGALFKNLSFAYPIGKKLSAVLCPKERAKFFLSSGEA